MLMVTSPYEFVHLIKSWQQEPFPLPSIYQGPNARLFSVITVQNWCCTEHGYETRHTSRTVQNTSDRSQCLDLIVRTKKS